MSKRSAGTVRRRPAGVGQPRSDARLVVKVGVVVLVITAVVSGFVGYQLGRPSSVERVARDLQLADIARDRTQTEEITAMARELRQDLSPVLAEMAQALPAETPASAAPAAGDRVARWRGVTAEALGRFGEPESAGTGVNIVRIALEAAVRQLALAIDTYEAATTAPAPRPELLALAARLRDEVVSTWSVGGIELDALNHEHDFGHVHIYLSESGE